MQKILIVDDNLAMLDIITVCLRGRIGAQLVRVQSGFAAIEALLMQRFDLVLLDLNLPDLQGTEVLAFIRAQDALEHLPVLAFSARSDAASRKSVLAAGATRFLAKPFSPRELDETVGELLPAAMAEP